VHRRFMRRDELRLEYKNNLTSEETP